MRAALIIIAVLAVAAPVMADEAPPPEPPAKVEIRPGGGEMMPPPIAVDDNPVIGHPKPSGYWTGYRPARGGAYRWRMMAVAAVVLGLTIVLLVRMLRRASASRSS